MRNVESSMDWLSFSNKMKEVACQLSSSACPMVLVLPDGREIRFADINVDTFDYKGKRGDTEYDGIGFRVNLLGAEVRNGKGDGPLANSPYGNGAKMREALECIDSIAKYLEAGTIRDVQHAYRNIQDRVRIALAAPPRNCDRFVSSEEALSAYSATYLDDDDARPHYATLTHFLFAEAKGDVK